MRFFIVTGMSGAGKSLAIKQLEDLGYFCIDNIPPALIPEFAVLMIKNKERDTRDEVPEKVALVVDIRGGVFFDELTNSLSKLENMNIHYEILFLDASDDVLIRRFKASRRKHPLAENDRVAIGLNLERERLVETKRKADYVLDTSNLTTAELKHKIHSLFYENADLKDLVINVVSFGFKYGIPLDGDFVFDARFLPNPFYVEDLRKHSGNDSCVQNYVMSSEVSVNYFNKIVDMARFVIPEAKKEGKPQIVIAIGCTGGRHRSVTLANKLAEILMKEYKKVVIQHRDIDED